MPKLRPLQSHPQLIETQGTDPANPPFLSLTKVCERNPRRRYLYAWVDAHFFAIPVYLTGSRAPVRTGIIDSYNCVLVEPDFGLNERTRMLELPYTGQLGAGLETTTGAGFQPSDLQLAELVDDVDQPGGESTALEFSARHIALPANLAGLPFTPQKIHEDKPGLVFLRIWTRGSDIFIAKSGTPITESMGFRMPATDVLQWTAPFIPRGSFFAAAVPGAGVANAFTIAGYAA